jgi:hypothetical protein
VVHFAPFCIQHDAAHRVVLVVQRELAGTTRAIEVPAVLVVGVVAQHVAGVVGLQVVAAHTAHQRVRHRVVVLRIGQGQRFGAGDGVVAGAAVQPVVAQAAVDDVVGVSGREQRRLDAAAGAGRVEVERRQVHRLLQLARDVDDAGLHVARGVDHLVEHVALHRAGVGVGGAQRSHAVQRLGVAGAVAAGEDAAVVAEHAVVAGAAGDPVGTPAADQVVVLAFAEQDVVAGHAVDEVVAAFAVQLVAGAVVAHLAIGQCIGLVVRAARRVVHQRGGARHDAQRAGLAVDVVVEGQVAGREGHAAAAQRAGGHAGLEHVAVDGDADQAVDVAVVAQDHVAVARMAVGLDADHAGGADRGHAEVVARGARAGAAEDQVAAVGPLAAFGFAEHRRAAADDVVLAQVAEDHVVAAVAFDVVVAVAGGLERGQHLQVADARAGRRRCAVGGEAGAADRAAAQLAASTAPAPGVKAPMEPSPWIVSSPSWPKIWSSCAPPAR